MEDVKHFREDVESKTSELVIRAVYSCGNFDMEIEQDPVVEKTSGNSAQERPQEHLNLTQEAPRKSAIFNAAW